jgi:hypothetical protein
MPLGFDQAVPAPTSNSGISRRMLNILSRRWANG